MKKMNIDKHITPHGFRHTHTSLLIEAGAGMPTVADYVQKVLTLLKLNIELTNIQESDFNYLSQE